MMEMGKKTDNSLSLCQLEPGVWAMHGRVRTSRARFEPGIFFLISAVPELREKRPLSMGLEPMTYR